VSSTRKNIRRVAPPFERASVILFLLTTSFLTPAAEV
jgi:hypothetical protein